MKIFLFIAVMVAMLAVLASLLFGLFNLSQEGRENREKSNKLMQWRVILQGLAILLMFLFAAASGGS